MASSRKVPQKSLSSRSVILIIALIIVLIVAGFYFVSQFIKRANPEVYNGEYVGEANVNLSTTKVPVEFPKDFPIPSSASLVSSWSNEDKNNLGVSVIWTSTEPFDSLVMFYKSNLEKNGYKVLTEFNNKPSYTISFSKGNMEGYVGIAGADKTTISVTVGYGK